MPHILVETHGPSQNSYGAVLASCRDSIHHTALALPEAGRDEMVVTAPLVKSGVSAGSPVAQGVWRHNLQLIV